MRGHKIYFYGKNENQRINYYFTPSYLDQCQIGMHGCTGWQNLTRIAVHLFSCCGVSISSEATKFNFLVCNINLAIW